VSLTPAEVEAAITPANAFLLSRRERQLYAKRAEKGDIEAARKLARFYFTNHEGPQRTNRDNEKADYWASVVARLAAKEARRKK
jgi:TPR repeat protein